MKKLLFVLVLALAAIGLSSCDMFNKEEAYGTEAQLIGKWQNEKNTGWHRVFLSETVKLENDSADYSGYKWGKEWHEDEGVYEDDLTDYGNGWFMWKKTGKDLFEIEFMEYDFARIPQENTITLLNDTRLEFTAQDGRKYQFNKVVSPK